MLSQDALSSLFVKIYSCSMSDFRTHVYFRLGYTIHYMGDQYKVCVLSQTLEEDIREKDVYYQCLQGIKRGCRYCI